MYYIVVTVFEYRYNSIEYDILCGVLDIIVYYSSWYNMDNEVNGSKSYLLWWGKWCLPKNAICVICSVLHIQFWTVDVWIFRSVDFSLQCVN